MQPEETVRAVGLISQLRSRLVTSRFWQHLYSKTLPYALVSAVLATYLLIGLSMWTFFIKWMVLA